MEFCTMPEENYNFDLSDFDALFEMDPDNLDSSFSVSDDMVTDSSTCTNNQGYDVKLEKKSKKNGKSIIISSNMKKCKKTGQSFSSSLQVIGEKKCCLNGPVTSLITRKSIISASVHPEFLEYYPLSVSESESFDRKKLIIPRILKGDVRRSYAHIFMKLVNANDYSSMYKFLRKYFQPDFVMNQGCDQTTVKTVQAAPTVIEDNEVVPQNPDALNIQGVANVTNYWYVKSNSMPDSVLNLSKTEIHSKANGTCKVISNFEISATKLYQIPEELLDIIAHQGDHTELTSEISSIQNDPQDGFDHIDNDEHALFSTASMSDDEHMSDNTDNDTNFSPSLSIDDEHEAWIATVNSPSTPSHDVTSATMDTPKDVQPTKKHKPVLRKTFSLGKKKNKALHKTNDDHDRSHSHSNHSFPTMNNFFASLPTLPKLPAIKPKKIKLIGKFIMYIDSNKKINKMEFRTTPTTPDCSPCTY